MFSNLTEEQRKRGGFVLIPPTLALAIVPDEVAYFIISPQDAGHITIDINYCLEPAALDDPLFEYLFEAAEAGVNNFNVQDIYVDQMTQKRTQLAARSEGSLFVAGGDPGAVQPLAGPPLPAPMARQRGLSRRPTRRLNGPVQWIPSAPSRSTRP